jgi:hypothetical protein
MTMDRRAVLHDDAARLLALPPRAAFAARSCAGQPA